MIELYTHQRLAKQMLRGAYAKGHKREILCLPTGGGKCFQIGTPILMFNGTIKNVENVVVGDVLMGPDSNPRNVLSLGRGQEMMYKVTPKKGDSYTVNESHILALQITGMRKREKTYDTNGNGYKAGDLVNITVKDYLKSIPTFKHCAKGYRTGVYWQNEKKLLLDPYILGLWLGDGHSRMPAITSVDDKIINTWCYYGEAIYGCRIRIGISENRTTSYFIVGDEYGINPMLNILRELNVCKNKHIPLDYLTSSPENRLQLLAGLIDTDGSLSKSGFDYITKLPRLADNIAFLCRSLGLSAYIKPCIKKCQNFNGRTYYRISISGDCDRIPTKLIRKQAPARKINKNNLVHGIKVEPVGYGDYYGFTIDRDGLFMLGDFTVVHNTITSCSIIQDSLDKPGSKLILVDRMELMKQWSMTLHMFGISFRLIRARNYKDSPIPKKVCIAMVESLWKRLKKDPNYLKKMNVQLIVADECHKYAFMKILKMINCPVLGLTATPLCSNPAGPLNEFYDGLTIPIETHELILQKGIVGSRTYSINHNWTGLKKKSNGEYTDDSQMLHFGKKKLLGGLVDHWKNYAHDKATVIYNVNIEHSLSVQRMFIDEGISCEHMDAYTSQDDRDGILNRFRRGITQVISNVGLLTTGNDEAIIECIALNRKIGLISTKIQIDGRGARTNTFPGGRIKDHFVCLDMGANHDTHGVFGEYVDWKAIFNNPLLAKNVRGQKEDEKVICLKCGGVNARRLPACSYCNESLEQSKRKVKTFKDMVDERKQKLEEIKQGKKANLPEDLRGLTPGQMTNEQLWRFIEHMGYKKSYYHVVKTHRKNR